MERRRERPALPARRARSDFDPRRLLSQHGVTFEAGLATALRAGRIQQGRGQNTVSTFAVAASANSVVVSVHGAETAVSLPSGALAIASEAWTHGRDLGDESSPGVC